MPVEFVLVCVEICYVFVERTGVIHCCIDAEALDFGAGRPTVRNSAPAVEEFKRELIGRAAVFQERCMAQV